MHSTSVGSTSLPFGRARHTRCSSGASMNERLLSIAFSIAAIIAAPALLVGCPQGQSMRQSGNDGGADADADGADASSGATSPAGSALCGMNGRNDCGAVSTCDPVLGCVECATDEDCPATAGFCVHGGCARCRPGRELDGGVSDCRGSEVCHAPDFSCRARCERSADCARGDVCDEVSGACLGCRSDADCTDAADGRHCNLAVHRCVACTSNETCPATQPRCRLSTGACVACTSNEDCGRKEPVCDPRTFTCRAGCTGDAHCPGQRCDTKTATCFTPKVADAGSDRIGIDDRLRVTDGGLAD